MLELHNMMMEPSNVRNKIREPLNMTKELSYVMLELHNVRIKSSNVRKKVKEHQMWKKKTVTYDVETVQCEDGIVKCKKKVT